MSSHSHSSSPLMEAPYSAVASASHAYYYRSENDSFASPHRRSSASSGHPPQRHHKHTAPQRMAHFRHSLRRARTDRDDQWMVRTAMKAFFLSPCLVLAVWAVVAVSFAHTSTTAPSRVPQERYRLDPSVVLLQPPPPPPLPHKKKSWFRRAASAAPPQQQQQQLIVQPQSLLAPPARGATQYYNFPNQQQPQAAAAGAPPPPLVEGGVSLPAQGSTTQYYNFPNQQQQDGQQQVQHILSAPHMPVGPNGVPWQATQYYNVPQQQGAQEQPLVGQDGSVSLPAQGATTHYDNVPQQQGALPQQAPPPPPQMPVGPNGVPLQAQGATTTQYYNVPQQQREGQHPPPQMPVGPNGVPLQAQGTATQYYNFPQQQDAQQLAEEARIPQQEQEQPALTRTHHSNLRTKNHPHHVQYFYYDPNETVEDEQGNLFLPQTVYDANGRAVSLQSLKQEQPSQIVMEPPSTMFHSNSTANATSSMSNYTHSHPNTIETPVHDNRRGRIAVANFDGTAWGESTANDANIIVATVGVMALLVGALSARRLRSRSILSVCLENETLEDDAAYDTAYTTSSQVGATASHYNTFAQGWKGDLEKFDV